MFIVWFEASKRYPQAGQLTYVEFPTKWTWDETSKLWKERKRGRTIRRLYYEHLLSGERYYLPMLLHSIKVPTYYEDLRIINGVLYETFKNACAALGLLDDDGEWDNALSEASIWATGNQLRNMFNEILMFCEIKGPNELWRKHWRSLSEDLESRTSKTDRR